jgi:hypothetical protein
LKINNVICFEIWNNITNFATKLEGTMAVFVKTIPTLCGSVADRFSEQASTNEENRASVDYTEQVESMRAILNESDLY